MVVGPLKPTDNVNRDLQCHAVSTSFGFHISVFEFSHSEIYLTYIKLIGGSLLNGLPRVYFEDRDWLPKPLTSASQNGLGAKACLD